MMIFGLRMESKMNTVGRGKVRVLRDRGKWGQGQAGVGEALPQEVVMQKMMSGRIGKMECLIS